MGIRALDVLIVTCVVVACSSESTNDTPGSSGGSDAGATGGSGGDGAASSGGSSGSAGAPSGGGAGTSSGGNGGSAGCEPVFCEDSCAIDITNPCSGSVIACGDCPTSYTCVSNKCEVVGKAVCDQCPPEFPHDVAFIPGVAQCAADQCMTGGAPIHVCVKNLTDFKGVAQDCGPSQTFVATITDCNGSKQFVCVTK